MSWTKRWMMLSEEIGSPSMAARVVEKMRTEKLSVEEALFEVGREDHEIEEAWAMAALAQAEREGVVA